MCLLWFSLCHRHCQEGEVEDGWPGRAGLLVAAGQLGCPSVPLALLLGGRGRLCPAASSSRRSPSQEEELSRALLPRRRRRRQLEASPALRRAPFL